ncbi:uncharacterized protein LOC141598572 [Silene latifolia]|uniref:uncharacterized protein LOC141598572 n=1 Tax=Silene latifolia TaxID=37657 RepID=UPI003D783979
MAKRKRNDDVLNQHHEDEDDDEQQLRAVFVDTNIDTNIIVLISPFSSFSLLKERIVREHANCFAELGEIKINALKVKREQKYYRLSESMLLRTAFHGVETWFVFADVDKASLGQSAKTHSDPVTELQLNLTNHEHASNLPNDPSKDSESEAMERGSDIGSPVAQNGSKRKRRKKEKHNSEDLSLALASSVPAENVHKIESIIAVDKSLLETKGLVSGFEGEPLETRQPVSKKDDLQKNDGASINFPSKVVETSTEGEVRTKEMRYNHPSIVRHVHGASSELEGSGKISGSTLNQDSVVHNAEAISESRVRKAKKNKKGGGDGADKIHSAEVGKGPDVMPYDVAAGRESDRFNTTIEETPLKQTDDSKLLLSRHEEVNKEDAPLMSSELKNNTESRNASKKRRSSKAESEHQDLSSIRESADPESADTRQKGASTTSGETLKEAGCEPRAKKTKKTKTKDVDGVDGSLQVLKSIQYDVTALDSEKAACERESNSKIIAEEKILETGNIAKKKKYKTKETDQDLDDSRQDVAEILQQADISKPEQNPESANVTEETKVDKSKPSKKTKKSKKNERASEVLPLIVNNNSAAEPAKSSKHEENSELMSVNPKKSKSRQTTPAVDVPENPVLQQVAEGKMADDDVSTNNSLSPNKHQTELNDDEHEHLNENAAQKVYSQETDMRNLVKQTTKKPKRKKLDQPSSIDTSSNLMAVEKGYESERTSLVSNQLQSHVQEAGLVKVIGVESFHPQLSTPEVNGEITGIRPKKKVQRKHSASEKSSSILHMKQQQDAETQKTADDDASLSANKKQTELKDGEHGHLNENSVQKPEANMRNLAKQAKNKSKRNKPDQPSSIDTSSNLMTVEKGYESERTSLVSHQLQSDAHKAELVKVTGVESSLPQVGTPEVNGEIASVKPKKKAKRKHSDSENNSSILHMKQQLEAKTQKTVVEQADDVMSSHYVDDADVQQKVSLHEKCRDDSTEVRKSDNQLLSNVKANKLDLSTSVDTPSNGENLSKVSERNAQAEIELQNNVQESELSGQIGTESSPTHQISQREEHLNIQSAEVIKPKEVSSSLAETRIPEKPRSSKQKVKNKDLPTSALAGSKEKNLTVSTSWKEVTATQVPVTDAVNTQVGAPDQNNPIGKSDVDGSKSSGTSSSISEKSAKTIHMGKNMKEVQKRKNQENSFKTPLNKKNQEPAFKTPANKNVGLPVSSVPQKKQLPATSGGLFGGLYSDSSDGEVERNDSSCSTRTPDDLSSSDYSSDYSEGESKGDVVTSQQKSNGSRSAREKTTLNLSAFKDQDIKSILRSSRRFKNAKLAVSQSQMEDGESEVPEFVPDSLPDS